MTDLRSGDVASTGDEGVRLNRRNDLAQLSDTALVIGIARRDHDAFAEVYGRYGASLHAPARQVCGHSRADEVVQDVFLRLWHKPESFDPERGSLRSYLMMQAHGRAVDLVRSDAARQVREAADVTKSPRTGVDVEIAAMARCAAPEVWRLLHELPLGERDAIALAFYGGYSYRRVAMLLDLPEGTIKSRIRSGLNRLSGRVSDDRSDIPWRA